MVSLDEIFASGSGQGQSSQAQSSAWSFGSSLSDLAKSTIDSVAKSASKAVTSRVESALNPTRGSTSAPVPDLAAQAATPGASFLSSKSFGVSAPIVILGAGVLAFLILRR